LRECDGKNSKPTEKEKPLKEDKQKTVNRSDRVLARRGARELTLKEIEAVSGAALLAHTNVCTAALATPIHTSIGDGDGCGDLQNALP
jgi:hypothetical protein